jgi:hypothetical protein
MLMLTLNSSRDGRYLARVVDQGSRPYVLDHGDREVIADLVQRLTRGFTIFRNGRLVHVHPSDGDLLVQLAEYYLKEGVLVALEEPAWHGRSSLVHRPAPTNSLSSLSPFLDLPSLNEEDDDTELVRFRDLPEVEDSAMQSLHPFSPIEAALDATPARPEAPRAEREDDVDSDDRIDMGLLPEVPFILR